MAIIESVNQPVKSDSSSKPAKKKKATKSLATENSPSVLTAPENSQPNGVSNSINGDGAHDNPYIRELQKSIRNVNKKITNASKVDNIIAENPDKTLDELVAARKINADQKAQVLKKPALQASLVQLEEQIAQYIKLDAEIKIKYQNEKEAFENNLKENARKELEENIAKAKTEAQETAKKGLEESLLLLSQFLKLAAIRRAEEEAAELEESKALEGLLAQVYSGDASAVAAMLNLINGSDKTLKSVIGEDLNVTYATLKVASMTQTPYIEDEYQVGESKPVAKEEHLDQTEAKACFTEINTANNPPVENIQSESYQTQETLQNLAGSNVGVNTLAGSNWDASNELTQSQEWVEVPHNTLKENDLNPNFADSSHAQSWADDQPVVSQETSLTPKNSGGDGFQEIQRNRGVRNHRGGRYDSHRGRGHYRGDGNRGRGRGGGGNRASRRLDD
ncbi:hypothetical protein OnM2_048011 [Erysiphe neolycopersici]|uniref:YAG7-like dimerisation domain-containing protein n=1 Tax=Erysiphe neolycopersici TaxID=212602 RepID=A0A420HTC1_9PEZI|nr:hypothetical protein OnM2_048011 [Erysiphe neolycopersici]